MREKRMHRAWLVLVGSCIIFATMFYMLSNGMALYVASICEELGFARAQFNLFFTGQGIAFFFISSSALKLTLQLGIRKVYCIFALLGGGTMVAMTYFTAPWQFCVAGILTGFSVFYPLVMTPIVLNNWFKKSYSTALGIATACSGLIGVPLSPILTSLILSYGWRGAMLIMAAAMELFAIPAIVLLIRFTPEEIGWAPYGADEAEQQVGQTSVESEGMDLPQSKKSGVFYMLFLLTFLLQFQSVMNIQGPAMMTDSGISAILMSSATSVQMVCVALGKITLGAIRDRTKSAILTTSICQGSVCAGALLYLMAFMTKQALPLYAGAALTGYGMAGFSILPSVITQKACGMKHFSKVYGPTLVGSSIVSLFHTVVVGWLYDMTGTHTASLLLVTGIAALTIPLTILSIVRGTRWRKQYGDLVK